MTSEFTWEHSAGEFFHPAVNCSTIDSFRNTQGASHYSGSTRSSIWKKILLSWEMLSDGIENLIENWSAWFLQTNLISTVLNTKFEYSHVFLSWLLTCLKFKYKRSRFPMDPAILLHVQRCTLRKGKHSGHCDCTHPNTIFIWIQEFELEEVPTDSPVPQN